MVFLPYLLFVLYVYTVYYYTFIIIHKYIIIYAEESDSGPISGTLADLDL